MTYRLTRRARWLLETLKKWPCKLPRQVCLEHGIGRKEKAVLLMELWENDLYEYDIELDAGRVVREAPQGGGGRRQRDRGDVRNSKTTRLTIKRKDGTEASIRLDEDQVDALLGAFGCEDAND